MDITELTLWIEPEPERLEREAKEQERREKGAQPKNYAKELAAKMSKVQDEHEALMKKRLRAAAYNNGRLDWERLFKFYDRDNSGQIDFSEFKNMVRKDAKITSNECSG